MEQLLKAAKQILTWYDDENDKNQHSTEEWQKAYNQLRNEVNFISSKPMLADSLKPLVDALEEYQKLLCDELDEVVGMAAVHGWKSSRHEQGKQMREKIAELKAVLNLR